MAVVQISRIQVRRGQKNQGSGLPQLASGEMAWAVDTQEMFVGNGAVAEGAPYVGNTKILTEHDNLLDFVEQYVYKNFLGSSVQTGSDPNFPVERSINQRLDDYVSALSFGAMGDGSTDNTVAIQRAIDQLFLNPATINTADSRVTLDVPAGTYILSAPVYIPSNCNIKGAGIGKTIFLHSHNQPAFIFINDTSTVALRSTLNSTTYNNQPKNISMVGFSVHSTVATETMMQLDAVRDSVFHQIAFSGMWSSLDGSNTDNVGFALRAVSDIVTCERLYFTQCKVSGFSYGIYSDYDINYCIWDHCEFDTCYRGTSFGQNSNLFGAGQLLGPRLCMISNSKFSNIDREGFLITNGDSNTSKSNRFTFVGNDGSTNLNAVTAHISFLSSGNATVQDWSDRTETMSEGNFGSRYFTAHNGTVAFANNFARSLDIVQKTLAFPLFRLPYYSSAAYAVNYMYQSISNGAAQTMMRKGTLNIAVDSINGGLRITDEYEFTGTVGADSNLQFFAAIVDSDGSGSVDTVVVSYTNSTVGDNGKFVYTYSALS